MSMYTKKKSEDVNIETGGNKAVETFKEACIFDLGYFAHNVEETDGCGVISTMFEMSEDDGSFITYDYRADSISEKPDGPTLYTLEWSKAAPADEIAQYEYFRKTIEEIAGYVGPDRTIPMDRLPAPLAAFASIYLLPAEAWYSEEESRSANDDMDMIDDGYHFDDDRLAELRLYRQAVELDAQTRAGIGPLAHDFVRRCQRLLILYSMGAPELIIKSEENKLAYTMTVHYRGDRIE